MTEDATENPITLEDIANEIEVLTKTIPVKEALINNLGRPYLKMLNILYGAAIIHKGYYEDLDTTFGKDPSLVFVTLTDNGLSIMLRNGQGSLQIPYTTDADTKNKVPDFGTATIRYHVSKEYILMNANNMRQSFDKSGSVVPQEANDFLKVLYTAINRDLAKLSMLTISDSLEVL